VQINILQIGKTKHSFIQEAEAEYLKRLSPYAEVRIQTLKEGRVQNNPQVTREDEAKTLLQAVPKHTFLIALDEHGREFSSPDFARQIGEIRDFGEANLTFIIGGPYGLDESVRKKANLVLSFSRFTFTHEMIRVLLLEQIYRSFMILANKTYHF
jgi:23S rRNA (pseudouridine1915-N3)-methyltransferase